MSEDGGLEEEVMGKKRDGWSGETPDSMPASISYNSLVHSMWLMFIVYGICMVKWQTILKVDREEKGRIRVKLAENIR